LHIREVRNISFKNVKKCRRMIKDEQGTERQCRGVAVKPTDFCRKHGGIMIRQTTKHGLYSKYHPPELEDLLEEQRDNPHLLDLKEQVVVVSALLAHVMNQIKKRQEASLRPQKKGKKRKGPILIQDREIATILSISDKLSRTIERTAHIGVALRYLVHLETLERVFLEWQEIAREFIPNPTKRRRFNQRLSARASEMILEDAEIETRKRNGAVKNMKEWREKFGKPTGGYVI
jgi:hypothetical protein